MRRSFPVGATTRNIRDRELGAGESVNPITPDSEINIGELISVIWAGKWIIALIAVFFTACSALYALSLPNMYKSTAVLVPVEASKGGGLSELARQFSGVASLAGLSFSKGSGSKSAEAIEVLQSWAFLEQFIVREGLAVEIFAANGWDSDANELLYNSSVYDVESNQWTRVASKGKNSKPSSWELYTKLSSFLSVTKSKSNNFVYIEMEHYSPYFAKRVVDALVNEINEKFRVRDAREASKNIEFLKTQISTTPIASMQTVFFNLIEDQTKTLMLAEGQSDYVFRSVSEARVAEQRSKPNRVFICALGFVLGTFLGVIFVVIFRFKADKERS